MNSKSRFPLHLSRFFFFPVLSAFLLISAFPPYYLWPVAWAALVPLLLVVHQSSYRRAFWSGYFFGIIYFVGMFWWLVHVTLPGMLILCAYLALFPGLFAVSAAYFRRLPQMSIRIFLFAALWTAAEYLRANLLSGFGWAALGHSQTPFLPVIQIADITGVAGVSFTLMLVNALIAEWISRDRPDLLIDQQDKVHRRRKAGSVPAYWTTGIVGAVLLYGAWSLLTGPVKCSGIRVGVIQPNIPQHEKWDTLRWPVIMAVMEDLSRQAAREDPDVIVWPETSVPGYAWLDPQYIERARELARDIGVPILAGMVNLQNARYYNSAELLMPGGSRQRYDKLHLVPFGEYLPLRTQLPFLENLVPIADFTAGEKETMLIVPRNREAAEAVRLGALICFEDTVGHVSRRLTDAGAQVLVNMTNDAWYRRSKAAYLHLQSAVFEAVSARRPLVRAANTGVSAVIDRYGKIRRRITGPDGKEIFQRGFMVARVCPAEKKTPSTKFGDVFTYFCFGAILISAFIVKFKGNAENHGGET